MLIDEIIKARKTQKVLANEAWTISESVESLNKTINELLDLAAVAPCHYACEPKYLRDDKELNSLRPYRFYVVDKQHIELLIKHAEQNNIQLNKLKNMMHAADALLMATWLPSTSEGVKAVENINNEAIPFEGSLTNMEHIAAASTAVQNVLLGATSRGIPNYWSSGGVLREKVLRNYLNISLDEIFLGALFLYPKDLEEREALIKKGALRDRGNEKNTFSKWVRL